MSVCQGAANVKSAIRRVPTTMELAALKPRLVPPPCRPQQRRLRLLPQRLLQQAECCRPSIVCKPPSQLQLQVVPPDRGGLQKRFTSITLREAIRGSFRLLMGPPHGIAHASAPSTGMPPPPPGPAPAISRGSATTQPSYCGGGGDG